MRSIEPEERGVALSFQDNSLFPHLNVRENLLLGIKRNSKIKRKIKLENCIKIFHLESILKKFPPTKVQAKHKELISLVRSLLSNLTHYLHEPFSNVDTLV